MNWTDTLKNAGSGWSGILANRGDWREHFALNAEGLNRAFVVYGIAALISMVLGTARFGMPMPSVAVYAVIAQLLPALALVLLTMAMRRLLDFDAPLADFLVPGLYFLALMKILEGLSVLIGLPLAGAILAITGFMCFKLARANQLSLAPAIGYAVVVVIGIAGLPIALYMLVNTLY